MSCDSNAPLQVDCIIKFGGAAITSKNQFETLNEQVLEKVADQVLQMYTDNLRFIIVHGAGSFGHFQAAEAGIVHGGHSTASLSQTLLGFSKTRLSVTKLNHIIVSTLVKRGIPAVAVSPLASWITDNRKTIATDGCQHIAALLAEGFVPVIHGDAVLDHSLKVTILSGDSIMTRLCRWFNVKIAAVYMTDVLGIYHKPPNFQSESEELENIGKYSSDKSKPSLFGCIFVYETGQWGAFGFNKCEYGGFETSQLDHDSTGGMNAKVEEAIETVLVGTTVRIVKAGTEYALQACTCDEMADTPEDWIGTELIAHSKLRRSYILK
jgi:isopentenyl phosphate kinase